MDTGKKMTAAELEKLEKRINAAYREAYNDLTDTIKDYFDKFAVRDAAEKARMEAGEISEDQYKLWRAAQIGRGKRFEDMRNKVAERMTNANETAIAYINDVTPGIYSLNRNLAAYAIEQVTGDVGFDLWDERVVKRLIAEQPGLMPSYPEKRALKRGIDLAYGKKQITASVTSSILQGRSIKGMADDLQSRITTMNRDSAIRTARTAVTGAQNAGRLDAYYAAEKMGIKCRKQWMATLDGRTRHSHAMLDGEIADNDKKFSNGCRFPGDPNGPPSEIYNCRCTLVSVIDGIDTSRGQRRARNPETGQNDLIENMTYAEWAGWKQKTGTDRLSIAVEKIRNADKVSDISRIVQDETKKLVDLSGMELDLAKENMEQILRLGDEYGYHFSEIVTTSGRAALGEVKRSGARAEKVSLQYPKKYYKDRNSLFAELRKSAAAGESPRLGRRQIGVYTTTHEFAHTLSEELTSRLYGYGEEINFWDEIETVYNKAKKDKPEELGKYAFSNQNEFLAECFAYAKLGGASNQYADEVLSIVDKYFRRKR